MSILRPIFHTVHAADIDVGGLKGIGPFQFEKNSVTANETQNQLGSILSTVITTLTVVAGLAFVIFFTLGGLKWLTAGGDKTKVQQAQQQMTQGVIGLVAVTSSLFIVGVVGGALGIDILNPFKTLFNP